MAVGGPRTRLWREAGGGKKQQGAAVTSPQINQRIQPFLAPAMRRPSPSSCPSALALAAVVLAALATLAAASADPGGRFARASPLRWGKRSGDQILRWGKRQPLRWGKRSVDAQEQEEEEQEVLTRLTRAAPLRWGKRSLSSSEEGGPALLRTMRAASPLRWGKRASPLEEEGDAVEGEEGGEHAGRFKRAPLRWGKRAPSRFGKRAPSRFGKRPLLLEDLVEGAEAERRADDDFIALNDLINRSEVGQ